MARAKDNKITFYHDDDAMTVVDVLSDILHKFGVEIEIISPEDADYVEYEVKKISDVSTA